MFKQMTDAGTFLADRAGCKQLGRHLSGFNNILSRYQNTENQSLPTNTTADASTHIAVWMGVNNGSSSVTLAPTCCIYGHCQRVFNAPWTDGKELVLHTRVCGHRNFKKNLEWEFRCCESQVHIV